MFGPKSFLTSDRSVSIGEAETLEKAVRDTRAVNSDEKSILSVQCPSVGLDGGCLGKSSLLYSRLSRASRSWSED